jgi:hypothetical protein
MEHQSSAQSIAPLTCVPKSGAILATSFCFLPWPGTESDHEEVVVQGSADRVR